MKRVLIVIDMQEDFVRGSLGSKDAEAIVSKVKAKITEYMERGDKIIFTRDTHRENYLETLEGKNLPVEHCIYGTEGWRIIPELVDDCKEYPDCSFIDKVTFGYENWKDIFGTVDEYGIELVGLCTDICVVSNALERSGESKQMAHSLKAIENMLKANGAVVFSGEKALLEVAKYLNTVEG